MQLLNFYGKLISNAFIFYGNYTFGLWLFDLSDDLPKWN